MNERNYAIDFIRLIAILGVIVIHVTSYFLYWIPPLTINFLILLLINQSARFSVPLFFVISGFVLSVRYKDLSSPASFYKKRLSKILLPYVSWSIIYFLIVFPHPLSSILSKTFLFDLIYGKASYQLYFIPTIIVLYFIFPLIILWKKIFLNIWFIIILTILEAIVLICTYFGNATIPIIAPVKFAFYNSVVFLVGIYFSFKIQDLKEFLKRRLYLFNIIALFSVTAIIAGSLFMFRKTGDMNFIDNQWRVSTMTYGLSVAAILYCIHRKSWNHIFLYLSGFSFGVFFVHAAILQLFIKFTNHYKYYNLIWFVMVLVGDILLSFAFCIVFSRIKIVNKILGLKS